MVLYGLECHIYIPSCSRTSRGFAALVQCSRDEAKPNLRFTNVMVGGSVGAGRRTTIAGATMGIKWRSCGWTMEKAWSRGKSYDESVVPLEDNNDVVEVAGWNRIEFEFTLRSEETLPFINSEISRVIDGQQIHQFLFFQSNVSSSFSFLLGAR